MEQTKQPEALKVALPCPQVGCGRKPALTYSTLIEGHLAACERHGTDSDYGSTPAEAVAKWNLFAKAAARPA